MDPNGVARALPIISNSNLLTQCMISAIFIIGCWRMWRMMRIFWTVTLIQILFTSLSFFPDNFLLSSKISSLPFAFSTYLLPLFCPSLDSLPHSLSLPLSSFLSLPTHFFPASLLPPSPFVPPFPRCLIPLLILYPFLSLLFFPHSLISSHLLSFPLLSFFLSYATPSLPSGPSPFLPL